MSEGWKIFWLFILTQGMFWLGYLIAKVEDWNDDIVRKLDISRDYYSVRRTVHLGSRKKFH